MFTKLTGGALWLIVKPVVVKLVVPLLAALVGAVFVALGLDGGAVQECLNPGKFG